MYKKQWNKNNHNNNKNTKKMRNLLHQGVSA